MSTAAANVHLHSLHDLWLIVSATQDGQCSRGTKGFPLEQAREIIADMNKSAPLRTHWLKRQPSVPSVP